MKASQIDHIHDLLRGRHKWFLGGGRRVIWAPPFPDHLDKPGFWDEACYLSLRFEHAFSVAFLERNQALPTEAGRREWTPPELVSEFKIGNSLHLTEEKTVNEQDELVSALRLRNRSNRRRTIDVVLYALVPSTDCGEERIESLRFEPARGGQAASLVGTYRRFNKDMRLEHQFDLRWRLVVYDARRNQVTGHVDSHAVMISEPGGSAPRWELTPFHESFKDRLPNTITWQGGTEQRRKGPVARKFVFVALHRRVRLPPRGDAHLTGSLRFETPGKSTPVRIFAGTDHDGRDVERLGREWDVFFSIVPHFRCSDPYFEKYYYYRWYGLRLNLVDNGQAPLRLPCVFEGINADWFRHLISYSAQVLPFDTRWMHSPATAMGSILNMLDCQRDDGYIPGGVLTGHQERKYHTSHIYHANWGETVRRIYAIHPDGRFLRRVYAPLCKYASKYFDKQRDRENSGLYDVLGQGETGQEYMSRYLFVDPDADLWGAIQLKGVDATVYLYQLQRALSWMAHRLGDQRGARRWSRKADFTGNAVLTKMWNRRSQMFFDVHPNTWRRSRCEACTCFYPFMTDLAGPEHLGAIRRHLLNPKKFWTNWPAPSTALDDPYADAQGRWKGTRMGCPWSGRTWLMTNSHIAEVLSTATRRLDRRLERHACEFLRRFVRMLFIDRDLERPTSYEYYNPVTGQAPFFRGVDDYMHSWIIDRIIGDLVGLNPQPDGALIVDPFDFGLDYFELTNCRLRGRDARVRWDGATYTISIDGRTRRYDGLPRTTIEL